MSKSTTPTTPPKGVATPLAAVKPTGLKPAAVKPYVSPYVSPVPTYRATPQHDVPATVEPLLTHILAWPRKHNSAAEAAFQVWLAEELAKHGTVMIHEEDAKSVEIKMADGKSATTLFSCHTDTIDPLVPDANDPLAKKKLTYDPNFGQIALDTTSVGGSLGADDGAGMWIMLGMLAAKVPGVYLFHRGEECGGISAKAIAAKKAKWLGTFEASVAFDRGHDSDVVTHQGGQECASPKFAGKLCTTLNEMGFDYAPSTGGTYTDNKEYRGIIAEVVNVSVGYESQHGRNETLDYAHLFALRAACIKLNWDSLPIDRDPSKADPLPVYRAPVSYNKWTSGASLWDDKFDDGGYDGWRADSKDFKDSPKAKAKPARKAPDLSDVIEDAASMSSEDLLWMATEEPEVSHDLIITLLRENARLKADVAQLETMLGV
jgi:hypothetical protein